MGEGDDKRLEITIATALEGAGIKLTHEQLEQLKGSLKGANENLHEHHHSFLHAESAARGFHHVLHELTEEFPVLGMALRLALSPVGGALIVATLTFREIMKDVEATKEAFKSAREASDALWISIAEGQQKAETELEINREAIETWAKRLHEVHNEISKAYDLEIAKLKQTEEATRALMDAELKRDQLRIQADATLTPEAKAAALGRLSQAHEEATRRATRGRESEEVAATVVAKNGAEAALRIAERAVAEANKAAHDEHQTRSLATLNADIGRTSPEEVQKKIREIQDWFAKPLHAGYEALHMDELIEEKTRDLKALQSQLVAHEKAVEARDRAAVAQKGLDEALEHAKQVASEARAEVEKFTDKLKALKQQAGIEGQFAGRQDAAGSEAQVREMLSRMGGPLAALIQSAGIVETGEEARIRAARHPGQPVSQLDREAMAAEDKIPQATKDFLQFVGRIIDKNARSLRDAADAVAEMGANENSTMARFMDHVEKLAASHKALQARQDALSRQLDAAVQAMRSRPGGG